MSYEETEKKNKGGRPRKGHEPVVPFEELDSLLVKGELVPTEFGTTNVVYPTYSQLAKRFGVSKSTISDFSSKRNCKRRRKDLQARISVKAEQKLIEYRAQDLALTKTDQLRMIDKWLMRFEQAVDEGVVRIDNPADMNTLCRLREFLHGNAESRKEIHNCLTLEQIQERHMAQLKIIENTTPGERGEVVERVIEGTIGRTRGGGNISGIWGVPDSGTICATMAQSSDEELENASLIPSYRYPERFLCPHCGALTNINDVVLLEDGIIDAEVIEDSSLDENCSEACQGTKQNQVKTDEEPELREINDELTEQPVGTKAAADELDGTRIQPDSLKKPNFNQGQKPNYSQGSDGQSTETPTPELPLPNKSGNSRKAHDNDSE